MTRRTIAAAVLAVALTIGAVLGFRAWHRTPAAPDGDAVSQSVPDAPGQPAAADGVETVDTGDAAVDAGATPMAQRVAVIGLLNKRNGDARDLTLKVGQAVRVGDTVVRLRACEETAPWETEHLTGAFVQLDVRGYDKHWRRVFSGWLYKERPSLNVVQHPVYDVWTKSCTMSFPDKGPDTVVLTDPAPRSAAKTSPGTDDPADAPTTPDSAVSSNAQ